MMRTRKATTILVALWTGAVAIVDAQVQGPPAPVYVDQRYLNLGYGTEPVQAFIYVPYTCGEGVVEIHLPGTSQGTVFASFDRGTIDTIATVAVSCVENTTLKIPYFLFPTRPPAETSTRELRFPHIRSKPTPRMGVITIRRVNSGVTQTINIFDGNPRFFFIRRSLPIVMGVRG